MIWDWLRKHPRWIDIALVVALLAASIGASAHHDRSVVAGLLAAGTTLPLLWRRSHPTAVLALVTAGTIATVGASDWFSPFQLALALYTVAATPGVPAPRRTALASIGAITLTAVVVGFGQFGDSAARLVFLIAAWLLGDSIGTRRAYVREIEDKAARLERERELHTRQVAAEEQARIARELHDVVAHALSVVVVQAAAADDVFDTDASRARDAVRAIEGAARSALGELRRVLGLLQDEAEREPQPGLERIDALVEQVRATGLSISLQLEGSPRPLPAAVDLSAYRIVQEALTNTLKHAGAEHATVRIRYGTTLDLEIRDDGVGAENGANGGSGLIGMRERVAILGGHVETRALPEGGFQVAAQLPL